MGLQGSVDFTLLLSSILGISLVIAAGCVFNNFIDRDIDKLMERTRNRPSAKGLLSGTVLIVYAILLTVLGSLILYYGTDVLALTVALIGLFFYVVVYSLWFKRNSVCGTLIGSISGAVPPVVGYCAVTNRFDLGALILFAMLCLWQMPHSYAIAIYRLKDYTNAAIAVLPVKKGIPYTKVMMLLYVIAFAVVVVLPTVFGYAGGYYGAAALVLGLLWVYYAVQGFSTSDDIAWAKKMFGFSILNITLLCLMMVVD